MDWIAILGLVVAFGVALLGFHRWRKSGPQLHLSIMSAGKFSHDTEDNTYIFVTATNRGPSPTTIRHLTLHTFDSRIKLWRDRPSWSAAVINPSPWLSGVPFEIGTNKSWQGGAVYCEKLEKRRASGKLYVAVTASHRDKAYYRRIEPEVAASAPS